MATTYTKKFKEFIQEWNPEEDDYIVGYRNLDDSEIRIPLLAMDNIITANKYIRKDIDDYANGLIRFNSGLITSDRIMSNIYLQGLDGWSGTAKGDFEMNSLTLREFLEVPELRKNKITVMGNQFWFTDSAMVKEAIATGTSNYDVYFKLEDEEYGSFELNDIVKGIYHYDNGFWTVYLRVYELILDPDTLGEIGIKVKSLNGKDPRQAMLLARMNNTDNPERQGSIFADGLKKYIRTLDGFDPMNPTSEGTLKTLKVQMGDLSSIVDHPIFGDLQGYGLYADNVYLTGRLIVKNDPDQPGQELGVYRGVWNATSRYYKYDQVTYNGSLYTSKQVNNIGHIPVGGVDDLWWELTVSKGDDGSSGQHNVTMELSNDNHTIPTDSEGKNPSYGGAYCTAYIYQGTTEVTDSYSIVATLELPATAGQVTFVQTGNTVTITNVSDDIDEFNIKFTGTAAGYPAVYKNWSVTKVKNGTPGEPATSYWIVTDTPVIKRNIFSVEGIETIGYDPDPFVVRAFSQEGQGPIMPLDAYFRVTYNSEIKIASGSVYQFRPSDGVSSYTIELFKDIALTVLLDKEIVSVVEDGTKPSWQTYIFKLSEGLPATPTYSEPPVTYPTPEGWMDYPDASEGIWWMSMATVNGITNKIATWSAPVKVTGEDGSAGQSTFKSVVFVRQNTQPDTPTYGSYELPVPIGWFDGIPAGDLKLWSTNRVFTSDGLSPQSAAWSTPAQMTNTAAFQVQYSSSLVPGDPESMPHNWSSAASENSIYMATREYENGVWEDWQVSKIRGEDGDDGVSAFKSIVFLRTNTKPAKPVGGSYTDPVPLGWLDGAPSGDAILWSSSRIFTSTGGAPQEAEWSDSAAMTSTASFRVRFSAVESNPGDPTTDVSNWSETASEATLWMATSTAINGVWGDWQISKIKGEKGADGVSAFKSIAFKRSNTDVTTPTGGSYSSPIPTGWSDGVPAGTAKIWSTSRIFSSTGGSPQTATWTTPSVMSNTVGLEIRYSEAIASPGTPTTSPTLWTETASSATIWMATRESENGEWKAWQVSKVRGEDGESAINMFKSIVFVRGNATPTKPTGGSYVSPIPAGWNDSIPSGDSILWSSSRIFTSNGSDPQDAEWSTPAQMTNTASLSIKYSSVSVSPGTPTSDPTKWVDVATEDTIWMATQYAENGVWSAWDVSRIKGESGVNGISVFKSIIFKRGDAGVSTPTGGSYSSPVPSGWSDGAPDGDAILWSSSRVFTSTGESPQTSVWTEPAQMTDTASLEVMFSVAETSQGTPDTIPANWSPTAVETSIWMATRVSENGTIGAWQISKIKGEKGDSGVWFDFKFAKNGSMTVPPTLVVTDRQPEGWSDIVPTIAKGEFLWMTNALIDYDDSLLSDWSTPVRINGEQGDTGPQGPQGLHGDDGLQGPSIAFGGIWADSTQYYGYADTQTCVYYNGRYYYTKTVSPDLSPLTIPAGAVNNPASDVGKVYWNEFVGQFDNIATGLLLAERIATAELTANKLFIVDRQESTGDIIAADGSIITSEQEKSMDPLHIIGRLSTGWYMDQGIIRSIAVTAAGEPKLKLDKDGTITATGVNVTGTVNIENGNIGSMQIYNSTDWLSTVNGPFPASSGYYYLRKDNGVTVTPQGHIIGKDYFLTGNSSEGPSVFIGDIYTPGYAVPGTGDSSLTSFMKLFNSLFERVLIGSQYLIKAKLPLFSVGDITAFGNDGMDIPSIWDSAPVDNVTIGFVDGVLTVIGGTGLIKNVYGTADLAGVYDNNDNTNTFNAYTIKYINDRVTNIEAGASLEVVNTGTGNVVSSVTKVDSVLTVNKGLVALTSHQALYALTFAAGVFAAGSYTPNSAAKTINIPTSTSHLTNNSGFLSAITKAMVEAVLIGSITTHTHIISNITGLQTELDGKAPTTHYHDYTSIVKLGSTIYTVSNNIISLPAYPTVPSALKNPNALTISLNGTSQGAYDGSAAKSINITAASVGAAASSHSHSYLPLSGGTMTGALYFSGTQRNISGVNRFFVTDWTDFQLSAGTNFKIFDTSTSKYLFKVNAGTTTVEMPDATALKISNNTVWHSGNDGSGSGLDADLLDGIQFKDLYISASSSTASVAGTVADRKADLITYFNSYGAGFGANTIVSHSVISQWNQDTAALFASSIWDVIKIGGGYAGTAHGQWLLSSYGDHKLGVVGRSGDAWTPLRWIAFETSNVASATKLATSRTLWGQHFNGTANVSGSLAGVTSISASGSISGYCLELSGATPFIDFHHASSTADYTSRLITTSATNLNCTSNFSVTGGIAVGNYMNVTGATTIGGTLTVQNNVNGAFIQVGRYRIVADDTNNALKIIRSDNSTAANFYATGGVSALGFSGSTGGGGSGLVETVYGYAGLGGSYSDTTLTDTFNAYTVNRLATRISSLEAGSALTVTTTGTGNVITSISKSGTTVTATKAITALTTHQSIYALTLAAGAFAAGSYTPNSAAKTINVPTHTSHLTNNSGFLTAITKAQVEAVLTGTIATHAHTFASLVSKPTTLTGYGITDSLTLATADSRYVNTTGDTMTDKLIIWKGAASGGGVVYNSGIEVRALGNVGREQSSWAYAPAISFHWVNTIIKRLGMRSDGQFAIDDVPISLNTHTHTFASLTSKPTTLAGYGITDSVTLASADGRYVNVAGDTMTGPLKIADGGASMDLGIQSTDGNGLLMYQGVTATYLSMQSGTTYIRSGSTDLIHRYNGTDHVILDARNYNSYTPTFTGIGATGTWGISVTGNAATSTRLATAKTLWGQSFNGTANVSGGLTGVTTIAASGIINTSKLDQAYTVSDKGAYGYRSNEGVYMYSYPSSNYLSITDAGDPVFGKANAIHMIPFQRSLFHKGDYQHYVVLLWKDSDINAHHISGKIYTFSGKGAIRYQAADIDMFQCRWSAAGTDSYFYISDYGLGTMMNLVTCTYGGEKWYGIRHTSIQSVDCFFTGTVRGGVHLTPIHYYTANPATVVNAEINNSITVISSTYKRVNESYIATVSGNVASATVLQTSRTINGTGFNGSANIVTSYWGTGRDFYIASSNAAGAGTAVSVNGSGNVTLRLPGTITAALVGNASSATALTSNAGSNTNPIYFSSGKPTASTYSFGNASGNIPISNGTVCTNLNADLLDGYQLTSLFRQKDLTPQSLNADNLNTNYICYNPNRDMNSWSSSYTFTNFPTARPAGGFSLLTIKEGYYQRQIYGVYTDNHLYVRSRIWSSDGTPRWLDWNKIAFTTDNVASATKLATARTINNTSFNGTADIVTAIWGAARTIGVVNSDGTGTAVAVAVNGSANVDLRLPAAIKASITGAVTGNATTATTLQTARTIWGQSFNGSAAISGAISGATTIAASGRITSAGLTCGYSNTSYVMSTSGLICNSWIRTVGAYGWYSETHGGGIYMTDTTWVRVFNSKAFYVANTADAASGSSIHTTGSVSAIKNLYAGNLANSCYVQIGKYRIVADDTNSALKIIGYAGAATNIYATGGVTALTASDSRLKENFVHNIDYSAKIMSLGSVVGFNYNSKAHERNNCLDVNEARIGLIYQNVVSSGIKDFAITSEDDGYGSINYLSPDFQATMVGAVQANILSIKNIESEADVLRRRIADLENEVKLLKEITHG